MEVAAIIPTRGQSRKVFSAYQEGRARALGYDKVYLVDYAPKSDAFDLIDRIKVGVQLALGDGIEFVSIIEDDDHYDLNYLDKIKPHLKDNKIVGINRTTYYHLFTTGWKVMTHPGRSSMFCTSFRSDLFSQFPTSGAPYHDLAIWRFVQERDVTFRLIDNEIAVGIKHGRLFGKVGGNGHGNFAYSYVDPKLYWLKKHTDAEAFDFYVGLKEFYQESWEDTK